MVQRAFRVRDYFLLNMNVVVRMLIVSDVIWLTATGLLGPIFALFIVEFIDGGSAAVAGLAAAIYLVTKSVLQIPIASLIDRIHGERDDFWILFISTGLAALTVLLYLVVRTPLQLYAVQFLYGILLAAAYVPFMAIYTRHINRDKEATAWGVYFTMTDLSAALAATLGGILADTIGFRPLIALAAGAGVVAALLIYFIRPHMRHRKAPLKRGRGARGRSRRGRGAA